MTNIIVGIDGSPSSSKALQWAVREGELRDQPVTAVLTWGLLNQRHPDHDQAFDPDYGKADAHNALEAYVTEAVGAHSGVQLLAVNDLPARGLLHASEGAAMLVLGGRGLGGFQGLLLGSVSYQALHHASCPVTIIRELPAPPVDEHVERIVVGIDGSDSARAALEWTIEEARLRHAVLEVVHAWQTNYAVAGAWGAATVDPAVYEEPARTTLDEAMDLVEAAHLARPPKATLVCDSAAHALLTAAKDADLLVTGARGIGGFASLLLGSTTTQVVHHAECPVVVHRSRS
jgi:nucleotide-binding universal stress UspA family protein